MVVYRKDCNELDTQAGTTATQAADQSSSNNEAEKGSGSQQYMAARAVLICRQNSHPFQERHLVLDQSVKIGRSVARCRPSPNNAIFDCKVLSRNHALLWYDSGKFYLQDTNSSNGTFVNNQRLSKGTDDPPAKEVCSGDIVQFGVDVVENSRKVTHGCIIATLKLYLPDGREAKASPTTAVSPNSTSATISTQDLYQLSQFLQEALYREQLLETKLVALQKVVTSTQEASEYGWKALIDEDRLLSRIETLESQLQACSKAFTEEKLREEVIRLQEDKDRYQATAKESLRKVLQEKLEALKKVQDLQNLVNNAEEECNRLRELCASTEKELSLLAQKNDEQAKELADMAKRIKEAEDKQVALTWEAAEEKEELKSEMRKQEHVLTDKIEALQVENDAARQEISELKVHLEQLKTKYNIIENYAPFQNGTHTHSQGVQAEIESEKEHKILPLSGALSPSEEDYDFLKGQLESSQKELEESRTKALDLNVKVKKLEEELRRVQAENEKNNLSLTILDHHHGTTDNRLQQQQQSDVLPYQLNGELAPIPLKSEVQELKGERDFLVSSMQYLACSVTLLQELLTEARQEKRAAEAEVARLKGDVDLSQLALSKALEESNAFQEQLHLAWQQNTEHAELIAQLQEQLEAAQQNIKQNQNEVEHLRKKVRMRSEEQGDEEYKDSNRSLDEQDALLSEIASLQARLRSVEAEMRRYRNENVKLCSDYKYLQDAYAQLESQSQQQQHHPQRGDSLDGKGSSSSNYWIDECRRLRSEAEDVRARLDAANSEILLLKERYAECTREKDAIRKELTSVTEEYQIMKYHSKMVSACSLIPLLVLIVAVLLAFYPAVSNVTATSESFDYT